MYSPMHISDLHLNNITAIQPLAFETVGQLQYLYVRCTVVRDFPLTIIHKSALAQRPVWQSDLVTFIALVFGDVWDKRRSVSHVYVIQA